MPAQVVQVRHFNFCEMLAGGCVENLMLIGVVDGKLLKASYVMHTAVGQSSQQLLLHGTLAQLLMIGTCVCVQSSPC